MRGKTIRAVTVALVVGAGLASFAGAAHAKERYVVRSWSSAEECQQSAAYFSYSVPKGTKFSCDKVGGQWELTSSYRIIWGKQPSEWG